MYCTWTSQEKRAEKSTNYQKKKTTKRKPQQQQIRNPNQLNMLQLINFAFKAPQSSSVKPRFICCESGFSYHRNNLLRKMTAESSAQFLHPLSSTHFTQEKICKTRCFDRIPSAMKTRSARRMMKT